MKFRNFLSIIILFISFSISSHAATVNVDKSIIGYGIIYPQTIFPKNTPNVWAGVVAAFSFPLNDSNSHTRYAYFPAGTGTPLYNGDLPVNTSGQNNSFNRKCLVKITASIGSLRSYPTDTIYSTISLTAPRNNSFYLDYRKSSDTKSFILNSGENITGYASVQQTSRYAFNAGGYLTTNDEPAVTGVNLQVQFNFDLKAPNKVNFNLSKDPNGILVLLTNYDDVSDSAYVSGVDRFEVTYYTITNGVKSVESSYEGADALHPKFIIPISANSSTGYHYVKIRAIDHEKNVGDWNEVGIDISPPSSVNVNQVSGGPIYPLTIPATTSSTSPLYMQKQGNLINIGTSNSSVDLGSGLRNQNPIIPILTTPLNIIDSNNSKYLEAIPSTNSDLRFKAYAFAYDNAGNESFPGTPLYLFFDNTPPKFSGQNADNISVSLSPAPGSNLYSNFNITRSGNAADEGCGLKNYSVIFKIGKLTDNLSAANEIQFEHSTSPASWTDFTIPFNTQSLAPYLSDRSKAIRVAAFLKANDNLNNSSIINLQNNGTLTNTNFAPFSSFVIPPLIEKKSQMISIGSQSHLIIDTTLNIKTSDAMLSLKKLYIKRSSVTGKTPLPGVASLFSEIEISDFTVITDDYQVLTDRDGYLVFRDKIPLSRAWGNKYLQYSFAGMAKNSEVKESGGTISTRLPNTAGTSELQIFDANHSAMVAGQPYTINQDGKVFVGYRLRDADAETWDLSLQRTFKTSLPAAANYQLAAQPETLGTVDDVPTSLDWGPWRYLEVPLVIGSNRFTLWHAEGFDIDGDKFEAKSDELILDCRYENGQYLLTVLSNSAVGQEQIRVRPGENLKLKLELKDGAIIPATTTIAWTPDQESPSSVFSGQDFSYVYHQGPVEQQDSDHWDYGMLLSITESSNGVPQTPITIPMTVRVEDTKSGALLEDERWHGDHTINGIVIVPPGRTLRIGSAFHAAPLTVRLERSLGQTALPGIVVQPGATLIVGEDTSAENAVRFTKGNTSTLWGTILAKGTVKMRNTILEYAQRALTAGSGSELTLMDKVRLQLSQIGLHVFGASVTISRNTSILNNSEYGVKEEQGGRPTLIDTLFSNIRNYYSWQQGPLSTEALKQLHSSSQVQGQN